MALRYSAFTDLIPLLLCILLSPFFCRSASSAEQRPNVLFIMVDDLRTSLGCYGDPLVKSPNIDRLAQTSRLFNRAYCHQAVCGPSRASILTGRLPDNTGVWHNRNFFRTTHPNLVTLPQLFKNNGYQALSMGKVFSGAESECDPSSWSAPEVLRADGWKNYVKKGKGDGEGKGAPFESADVPDDGYSDGKLANLAIEMLTKLKQQSQPFFSPSASSSRTSPSTRQRDTGISTTPPRLHSMANAPAPKAHPRPPIPIISNSPATKASPKTNASRPSKPANSATATTPASATPTRRSASS